MDSVHTSHFPAAYEPAFDGERAASLCHIGICDRKGSQHTEQSRYNYRSYQVWRDRQMDAAILKK